MKDGYTHEAYYVAVWQGDWNSGLPFIADMTTALNMGPHGC
jgi:hypothetical protein